MMLGKMLVLSQIPADVREGAKILARLAQVVDLRFTTYRLEALQVLQSHADKREVVGACCIGCGATHRLKRCAKCDNARFCGMACMQQMWPTHKRCCKKWAAQRDDAPE
mmetsp:Transcript_24208/g.60280  ORF Transcript_24208/g.60280 Transcript_24208/m.60280 type:complete len:109 (+) Transcript_24208:374-700(+)